MKPFSIACEENKEPILEVLRRVFATRHHVFEIGSGTGQHAVYFAEHLPHLIWQPSDRLENHPGILAWIKDVQAPNVRPPLALDVDDESWPIMRTDAIFSANTTHIMSWPQVINMFRGCGKILETDGVFCLYGPFNEGGAYTSDSNARFDIYLKQRDPLSGIRNIEDLAELGKQCDLQLIENIEMPVNNRTLIWKKLP